MTNKRPQIFIEKDAIRNWTLYVVRFTNGSYYIGITSYKDFMRRISQHGGRKGARWNKGKILDRVIETRQLGRITRIQAENIENDVTLEYRKRFGRHVVRGGYNAYVQGSFIPNFTPGSMQMYMFLVVCLLGSLLLILFMVIISRT